MVVVVLLQWMVLPVLGEHGDGTEMHRVQLLARPIQIHIVFIVKLQEPHQLRLQLLLQWRLRPRVHVQSRLQIVEVWLVALRRYVLVMGLEMHGAE